MGDSVQRDFLPYVGGFAVDPQLYPELLLYPLPVAVLAGLAVLLVNRRPPAVLHGAVAGYVAGAIVVIGILPDLPMPEMFGAPRHPVDLRPLRSFFPAPETAVGWESLIKQYAGNIAYFMPFGAVLATRPDAIPRIGLVTLAAAGLSALVEVLQFALGTYRVVSLDDVLMNTLGGLAAAAVVVLIRRRWRARPAEPNLTPER